MPQTTPKCTGLGGKQVGVSWDPGLAVMGQEHPEDRVLCVLDIFCGKSPQLPPDSPRTP